MHAGFPGTARALREDGAGRQGRWAALGMLVLALWATWLIVARIGVWAVSDDARLERTGREHPVESPVLGEVVAVRVALGERVSAGQVLVELDAQRERRALDEAKARRAGLAEQLGALTGELSESHQALEAAKRGARDELSEVRERLAEATAAADLATADAARVRSLADQGIVGGAEVEAATAAAEQRRAARAALAQQLDRVEWERRAELDDREARLLEREREAARLRGEIDASAAAEQRLRREADRLELRAPIAGVVAQLSDRPPGSVVDEGELVATVLPEGSVRGVATFAPAEALGRIRPGQSARLRLKGFPWTRFGTIGARVVRVAAAPDGTGVRVELELTGNGGPPIEHGLPASVEVEVERTSPWRILLEAAGRRLASAPEPTAPLP
jgi:multidrug resistance efflux pump